MTQTQNGSGTLVVMAELTGTKRGETDGKLASYQGKALGGESGSNA